MVMPHYVNWLHSLSSIEKPDVSDTDDKCKKLINDFK